MRKSLRESALEQNKGRITTNTGIVDIVLRNEDGSIDKHIHQRNLVLNVTTMLRAYMNYANFTPAYLFVLEKDRPLKRYEGLSRNLSKYGTGIVTATVTPDINNRIVTMSAVIPVPSAPRPISIIGCSKGSIETLAGNVRITPVNWMAATRLSAAIIQGTSQTVEVSYRIAFQRI